MARKYVTSDIVDPVKVPFSKRSLTHLNAGLVEGLDALVQGLIGVYTPNDLIILYGCAVTLGSGSIPGTGTASLTAGAIYYNGEIYDIDASPSLSTTTPQTLIWQVVTTYISGDPALFSDGNTHNFHRIDKLQLVAGTAGAGVANYDGTTVKELIKKKKLQMGVWNMDSTSQITVAHGVNQAKIINVTAIIFEDGGASSGTFLTPLFSSGATFDAQSRLLVGVSNITIERVTGGFFDNTNFNDGSMNRGYVMIEYGDI